MPTPSSGQISFLNLQNTFGTGSPVSFAQLYRGGTFVPNITPNNAIPTASATSISNFYGTWGRKTLTFTMNIGSHSSTKTGKGTLYGFGLLSGSGSFGSISSNTFLTPNGTMVVQGLYYSAGNGQWHLQLAQSGAAPADTDLSFRQVSIAGYNINGIRSARTATSTIGTARQWRWTVSKSSHPTSGTVACTIQYYG
jgi:hypothetical protein